MPLLKPIRAIQLNRSHPLARGLVGCWLLNEGTGGKAFDLSENRIVLSLTNTDWVSGRFGFALETNASGEYGTLNNSGTVTSEKGTIVMWFKSNSVFTDGLAHCLFGARGPANNSGDFYIMKWSDNYVYFLLADTSSHYIYFNSTSFPDWQNGQQIVVQWDRNSAIWNNNKMVLAINGQYKTPQGSAGQTGWNIFTIDTSLGVLNDCEDTSRFADGRMGYCYIYGRVLSVYEIAWLFREPFCMFDVPTKQGLLYPVGQTVWLTAVSTATASAQGSLTRCRKLAGIVSSAAALSGILKLCYRGQVERQWLIDALFNGMTTNAFKLGTVLTGGWFWMRRAGCCALYRGPSMEQVDFANILTVAEQDADSISPPSYMPHPSSSTYFYVVRRFNNCGYQERTLAAAVKVSIDSEGDLAKPQPNDIFTWRADQVDGNKTKLIWFYCPLEQKSRPARFMVYYDGGTGLIDYQNPIATINYQGRKFYTYKSDALPAGRYLFAVRAEDADGLENNSLAQLAVQISAQSPDAIEILSAEV